MTHPHDSRNAASALALCYRLLTTDICTKAELCAAVYTRHCIRVNKYTGTESGPRGWFPKSFGGPSVRTEQGMQSTRLRLVNESRSSQSQCNTRSYNAALHITARLIPRLCTAVFERSQPLVQRLHIDLVRPGRFNFDPIGQHAVDL